MLKAYGDGRFLRHSRERGNPVGPASVPVVQESPAGTPALLPVQVRDDHAAGVTIPANRTKFLAIAISMSAS
jgi:hypothetical protein